MPTENRSSNTEQMVSVPRELLERAKQFTFDLLWPGKLRDDLQAVVAQPADQDQGYPVALPGARVVTPAYNHDLGGNYDEGYSEGWNAYNDEMAKLGPLYTHPAPVQQGEPVGEVWEDEHSVLAMLLPPGYSLPAGTKLYTHADAGKVERLRASEKSLAKDLAESLKQQCADMRTIDALRAQMAEAHALLRDINKRHSSGVDFDLPADLAARVTALSASAEPSATKCEDCSGTGSPGGRMHANGIDAPEYEPYKCEKCDGFGIVGNILNAETCTDCTPSAPVERDELVPAALMLRQAGFGNLADAVDEARAALERKP